MEFKSQTASKTSFKERSPAISHLLKFAFSPGKRENTLKVSIKFLTDNKSLRKKVESSAKVLYKKHDSRLVYLLCQHYFLLIQRELLKQV